MHSNRDLGMRRLPVVAVAIAAVTAVSLAGPPLQPQPPMGDPLDGLTAPELAQFDAGKIVFSENAQVEDGLGPIFNQTSCASCHNNPVGGPGSQTVTRAGMSDKGSFDSLEDLGGSLFQQQAIDDACAEVVPPMANVVSLRVTPGMMGYGLVEAIADADILAIADPDDLDADFISGRVHMVGALEDPPMSPLHVGRFGWKAQDPTMMTFSAGASLNEIGLTNPLVPDENDPNGVDPPAIEDCDTVADPERDQQFLDDMAAFQRFLAAPPQTPRSGMAGEAIFNQIGCNECHTASFTTPNDLGLEEAIRNKTVKPYSDFLLHDVGQAADFIPQGDATEREIKTSPLMGLSRRDPMWHDGRFGGDTFENRVVLAILEHGAFGSESRNAGIVGTQQDPGAWQNLSQADRDAVVVFLESLGRREFDVDRDDAVELNDFIAFHACYDGGGGITADDACAISDVDQNGDVDGIDYDTFLIAYTGPRDDCDNNGVLDLTDILDGTLPDVDNDGLPDGCNPDCRSDLDASNSVDVTDLMELIGGWGVCPGFADPCPGDVVVDFEIDVRDMLELLGSWGPCP